MRDLGVLFVMLVSGCEEFVLGSFSKHDMDCCFEFCESCVLFASCRCCLSVVFIGIKGRIFRKFFLPNESWVKFGVKWPFSKLDREFYSQMFLLSMALFFRCFSVV